MSNRQGVVLCIGNDQLNLNLRCALLKEYGWRVLSAGSGHSGVTRFSQEPVDVVVIDLNHDGSESALITAELKRQRPQVPVIMLVLKREGLAEGATLQADAVLLKADESRLLHDSLRQLHEVSR